MEYDTNNAYLIGEKGKILEGCDDELGEKQMQALRELGGEAVNANGSVKKRATKKRPAKAGKPPKAAPAVDFRDIPTFGEPKEAAAPKPERQVIFMTDDWEVTQDVKEVLISDTGIMLIFESRADIKVMPKSDFIFKIRYTEGVYSVFYHDQIFNSPNGEVMLVLFLASETEEE